MLRTFNLKPIITTKPIKNTEMSRILSAAVINEPFRQLLLDCPQRAIETGFHDEYFQVNAQELAKIEAIHASNLVDFATKISSF
ncbi:MAG: hypothetical protein GYA45_10170 [Pelolinea sp.]|jgi:hypothetical protein|nr:hypothetical protein [Pelolinea sp.]